MAATEMKSVLFNNIPTESFNAFKTLVKKTNGSMKSVFIEFLDNYVDSQNLIEQQNLDDFTTIAEILKNYEGRFKRQSEINEKQFAVITNLCDRLEKSERLM